MEQRSEGDPGLPSISIALEAPCTGLGGGPADEGAVANASIDASDETISKSAASTKNVIDRLLRLPHRSSERVDGRLLCRRSLPSTPVYAVFRPKRQTVQPSGRKDLHREDDRDLWLTGPLGLHYPTDPPEHVVRVRGLDGGHVDYSNSRL